MAIGDIDPVPDAPGVYCVDTGMYDTEGYGSVYVVDADRPALVDTGIGTNYERILDALAEVGIEPAALECIVPTHVHLDHAGGAGFLARECPNADVYVHEIGAPHLVDPERLWAGTKQAVGALFEHYTEPEPVPEERIVTLADGDVLDLGDRALDVHHAPGHAPHQVVLFEPDARTLFVADAAGIYVPPLAEIHPTSPPPNFDLEACLADVATQQALEPETLCYGHFGPAPADDRLAEYAAVIEGWVEAIADARAELEDDEAVVERFVEANDLDAVWGAAKTDPEARMNVRGVLHYLDRRG
jgi:glyoxylase-like metal-dependent hydrolase (beta-lactamase superfamily II)